MMQARHRTVLILLLALASAASPAIARQPTWWLAQVDPDAPEVAPEAPVENTPVEDASPDAPSDVPESVPSPDDEPTETPPTDGLPPAPVQPSPTDEEPPELTPPFMLPESLPEGTSLRIAGSSSMTIIADTLKQQFEASYPETAVTLDEQVADAAIQSLQSDQADIAAIGRPLTEAEKAAGLREIVVSRDKIALIVGAQNPFEGGLDAETFVQIFRGQITNWNQVGGPEDQPIRLVDRPATSDIRASLGNYAIFAGDLTTGDNAETVASDSTAAVVDALGRDGLGYAIANEVLDQDNVRVLFMSGTSPDDPRYPYSQSRRLVYQGDSALAPEVEAFLALATNPDGQAAIADAKVAEAADVAVADLPKQVVAMRPVEDGFVTGDRQGNLNFWRADGRSAGDPESDAHTGPVTALAFSPDGQRLVSGGADGAIRLWDAVGSRIGDPINTAGQKPVTSLVVKADGSFISGSTDGSIQQWDNLGNPTGEAIAAHTDTVTDIALTADGQSIVTASKDGTLRQWAIDGTPKGEPLVGHTGPVNDVAIKPDGNLVSGGADGVVRQWNAEGAPVGETPVSGPISALATAPDGHIAVGSDNGDLQLLDSNSIPVGEPIAVNAPIDDVSFSPSGDRLIVSAGDTPEIRDATGQLIATPETEADSGNWVDTLPLPPELADSLRGLGNLPPQVLWLIPIAVIALLVLGLLRSLSNDEDETFEDEGEVAGALPVAADTADVDTVDDGFDDFDLDAATPAADFGVESGNVNAGTDTFDDFDTVTANDFAVAGSPVDAASFVDVPPSPTETAPIADPKLAKARQAIAQGVALAKANRHEAALDAFNQAIEATELERLKAAANGVSLAGTEAMIAKSLAQRGTTLVNLGRLDEALKSLDHSLEMEPREITAWLGKGHLMTQKGRFDEAIFCFDKAIALNSNLGAPWQGKGMALQSMGRTAEANECFAKAQSLGVVDGAIPVDVGTPVKVREPDIAPAPVDATDDTASLPAILTDFPDAADTAGEQYAYASDQAESTAPSDFGMTAEDLPADFQDVSGRRSRGIEFDRPVPDYPHMDRSPVRQKPATESGIDFDTVDASSTNLQNTLDNLPAATDTSEDVSRIASPPMPSQPARQPQVDTTPSTRAPDSVLQTLTDLPDHAGQSASVEPDVFVDSQTDSGNADADVPQDVLDAVKGLPTATEAPVGGDRRTPPIDVPPEVAAILAGTSNLPSSEDAISPTVAVTPSVPGARRQPSAAPVAPPSQPSPARSQSESYDPDSSSVPSGILEILQGLPDNTASGTAPPASSAPKKRVPPPPPSNPRLRKPPSS
ncbi:MAG: substrate-binding domain-containing protein [Cyanobacteria bacterium J06638_28]